MHVRGPKRLRNNSAAHAGSARTLTRQLAHASTLPWGTPGYASHLFSAMRSVFSTPGLRAAHASPTQAHVGSSPHRARPQNLKGARVGRGGAKGGPRMGTNSNLTLPPAVRALTSKESQKNLGKMPRRLRKARRGSESFRDAPENSGRPSEVRDEF